MLIPSFISPRRLLLIALVSLSFPLLFLHYSYRQVHITNPNPTHSSSLGLKAQYGLQRQHGSGRQLHSEDRITYTQQADLEENEALVGQSALEDLIDNLRDSDEEARVKDSSALAATLSQIHARTSKPAKSAKTEAAKRGNGQRPTTSSPPRRTAVAKTKPKPKVNPDLSTKSIWDATLRGGESSLPNAAAAFPAHIPLMSSTHRSDVLVNTATSRPSKFSSLGSYEQTQGKLQDLIKSYRPPNDENHWPPYEYYINKQYNPNVWEAFPWDVEFYISNGIRSLQQKVEVHSRYPDYNSDAWRKRWKDRYVPCVGARGRRLDNSDEDDVKAIKRLPMGFPIATVGDAEAIGIDVHHCFDRYNRFGAYGHGQSDRKPVERWQRPASRPDWKFVDWGKLQDQCLLLNKERYAPTARQPADLAPETSIPNNQAHQRLEDENDSTEQKEYHARSAVLVRSHVGYEYTPNDKEVLRSLITELSLRSGGEYTVFLFVKVTDVDKDIWSDKQVRDKILEKNVPREFRNITILWSEKVCQQWYSKVGDWQVHWHHWMPVQWFSRTHPEFEYVWNWEIDARYTGHHYEFLEAVTSFARNRPRKYLWERNSRFHFPSLHGTYDQFLTDTDTAIEQANAESSFEPVWGPRPYELSNQKALGPKPPHAMKADQFSWGVGEEADLITFQPIFDPNNTEWSFKDKIWNFVPARRPQFTEQDPADRDFQQAEFANIPRRVFINTLSRLSKRQLYAMHIENLAGRTMASEMWPASVALQHGLKAVYAPHPIWTDHKWPAWYLEAVFNANGNKTARWSQESDSVYNQDREYNFGGWSWYFDSELPRSLYRRWLGWETEDNSPVSGAGGKDWEDVGAIAELFPGDPGTLFGGQGRMCLPPMLLHPVKKVKAKEAFHKSEVDEPLAY